MSNRETIVCYCQPPISKGVQFIHAEMFHIIKVLKTKFDVHVVARSRECYEWYLERFGSEYDDVNFIEVPKNLEESGYIAGLLDKSITDSIKKIDRVFVFSAGMEIVTPFDKLQRMYQRFKNGIYRFGNVIDIKTEDIDAAICHEAEFLWSVIKHSPKIYNRVVDYTEVDIEKCTGYPMKKYFYYVTPELIQEGFHKLHDSELFFLEGFNDSYEKTLDFMYGWTVEIPERAYLSEFCFSHIEQTDKVKLFCKDKYYSSYAPITTQLDSDEYYKVVASAKFSLIAPSTTPQNVPVFRIYEDLSMKTIPIFMKTVQYHKAFEKDLCDFITENLVYDETIEPDFNLFLYSLDYDKLWEGLMSCESLKRCLDKEWIYSKILEELD